MSNATRRPYLLHYSIAVLSVLLALALTKWLQPFIAPATLSLFYAAVAISTRYGGMKAGIVSTVLSSLFVNYFFIPPFNTFSIRSANLAPLSVFILVTLLISSLDSKLKRAKQRVQINQQALAESEERYRILAENVPQMVWNARPDGYVKYFNQRWYDYTGLTASKSLGWEWQRAIHPDDLASTLKVWKTGLATGSRVESQYRLQTADGNYRWHITRAVPQRNSQGKIANWFGSCTDIHDQKQAEQERTRLLEELESKQRLLEAVLQQMPAGLLVAEAPSGRFLLKNEQVRQILGEDLPFVEELEEYKQFHYEEFHTNGRVYQNQEKPLVRSLTTGEVVTNEEIELVCADGTRKTILVDSSPIRNEQGEIVAAIVTFYDISDRKQIQREIQQTNQTLKTLIAASPLPIVVIEPDSTVRLWNPAAEQLFGWSEAEVLGKSIPIVPEDKYEECRLVREMLLNGETFYGVETYRCSRDNSRTIVSISAAPILDESGTVNTMMLIFQDITARQQAEMALRESEERFRQLAETIQDVFWVSNPFQGEIFYVSPAYEQVWGRSCESLYADPGIWIETVYCEDRERLQRTFFSQITQGKYDTEYRILRPDGSIRWIRDRGYPIKNDSGEIYRVVGVAEDITEAKLAQIALRDALQRLNFHVENTPLAVIEWDTDLRITRWSAAAEKIFGWQAEEVLGKPFGDWPFVHEEDLQFVLNAWSRILSGNESQIFSRNRNYTKAGEIVHCEWYNSSLTDEAGNMVSVLSLVQDVTKRHCAQQELEQSEARFRLMADSAPVFIWMSDTDGHFTYMNQPWLNFVGQTLDEALRVGRSDGVHPEDYKHCFDTYIAAFNERQPFELEYRYRRADGEYRWILDKGIPLLMADGTFAGYIGSGIDITDRKNAESALRQSEESLSLAMEAAQMGFWDWNLSSGKITWSYYHARLFGLTQEDFQGNYESFLESVHPEDRPRIEQAITDSIQGDGNYETEFRVIWPDQSIHWIVGKGQVFYNSAGQGVRMIGVVRDNTDRKLAEQEREALLRSEKAARESAETANRIKDEFLAVLSHELRSPLNPILGWTKLLRSRKFDADATDRALETIERNAKLQTQLIEDLLDVSRILRGKLSLNVICVNLARTIDAALETVSLSAEAKSIQIHKEIAPDVGLVAGDPNRLQQVVWNLLSNAIKFTPSGGRVEVRLSVVEGSRELDMGQGASGIGQGASGIGQGALGIGQGALGIGQGASGIGQGASGIGQGASGMGKKTNAQSPIPNSQFPIPNAQSPIPNPQFPKYAQITVSDTGKGIKPEFLPYVFDYFRQADSGTTRNYGGLGLGLAIVRHIVESHGGTVGVESPGEGQGATFRVQLPLVKENKAQGTQGREQGENLSPHSPLPSPHSPLTGMRILAVDDEADMRDYVNFVLQQYGANVTVVASASEALTALLENKPDVLVSDIGMPNIDGYMLLRQVRTLSKEQGGQIPAIALTAYAGEYDQKRAIAAGFGMHLSKPVEPDVLVKAITSLVKGGVGSGE